MKTILSLLTICLLLTSCSDKCKTVKVIHNGEKTTICDDELNNYTTGDTIVVSFDYTLDIYEFDHNFMKFGSGEYVYPGIYTNYYRAVVQ